MSLSKTYYLCIHYLLNDYDAHVLYIAPFEMLSRIQIILAQTDCDIHQIFMMTKIAKLLITSLE